MSLTIPEIMKFQLILGDGSDYAIIRIVDTLKPQLNIQLNEMFVEN